MEQGKYICDLPMELLWQTGMILYLLKRPFKIDLIDGGVCRFRTDMDVETARKMLTLLKREIEAETNRVGTRPAQKPPPFASGKQT